MNNEKLISDMTLEEKIAQLNSVFIESLVDEDGGFSFKKAEKLISKGIGQVFGISGRLDISPKTAAGLGNTVQRYLVENTRQGIPAIIQEECLCGFMAKAATIFPQAIGIASTWNPELARSVARVIGRQMRLVGAHQGFAPVLDVCRDLRWGRVEETFGEDPYLVARMGVSYIMGLQGEDLTNGIAATAKHFAAHGFSEGGRNCAPVHTGPRELRDVFLFPFEAAVAEADVESVMNAYHDIDGIPCVASRELLTEILRNQWGFNGTVIADAGSVDMLREFHRIAGDKKEAAILAFNAGVDVELPGMDCYGQPLLEAVERGLIAEEAIEKAVKRILLTKSRLGILKNPYVDAEKAESGFDSAEDRALAREAARQSIVLLRNEGNLLPLGKDIKSLAVIGPNAASTRNLLGDYSYAGLRSYKEDTVHIVSILNGIRSKVNPGCNVIYAEGCRISDLSRDCFKEAVIAAEKADVVVYIAGDRSGLSHSDTSGENRDRADLSLPGVQLELMKTLVDTGKPVVTVLVSGRPMVMKSMVELVPAIVMAWLPGEEGGNAVADILFGDYNPAARLPISLPLETGQLPVNYNLKPTSNIDYVFCPARPLFEFGYGLSYSRFVYENLYITPQIILMDGQAAIGFDVTNTGDIAGDEVVQLYIRDQKASITRPERELKGFKRVSLKAGEKKRVEFVLYVEQMAFCNSDIKTVVEPGIFEVMVGSSSLDIKLKGSFEAIGGHKEVNKVRKFFCDVE